MPEKASQIPILAGGAVGEEGKEVRAHQPFDEGDAEAEGVCRGETVTTGVAVTDLKPYEDDEVFGTGCCTVKVKWLGYKTEPWLEGMTSDYAYATVLEVNDAKEKCTHKCGQTLVQVAKHDKGRWQRLMAKIRPLPK